MSDAMSVRMEEERMVIAKTGEKDREVVVTAMEKSVYIQFQDGTVYLSREEAGAVGRAISMALRGKEAQA